MGVKIDRKKVKRIVVKCNQETPRGEPRLELGVHVFGFMWNYFGIHQIKPLFYILELGNERGSGSGVNDNR